MTDLKTFLLGISTSDDQCIRESLRLIDYCSPKRRKAFGWSAEDNKQYAKLAKQVRKEAKKRGLV